MVSVVNGGDIVTSGALVTMGIIDTPYGVFEGSTTSCVWLTDVEVLLDAIMAVTT